MWAEEESWDGVAERMAEEAIAVRLPNGAADPAQPPATPALEADFHRAMVNVYARAKRELNYSATYFLQMVSEVGGLDAARRLLAKRELSDGFTELYLKKRLDLTVEAQVLRPEFRSLFSPAEIATAQQRLAELGYQVA